MTVEATSLAAYVDLKQSGTDVGQREMVHLLFRKHGPMADFEASGHLPEMKLSSFHARRRELNKLKIVGIMPGTKIDPKTNKEVFIWGLVDEHDAKIYHPVDIITVRVNGESRTLKFSDGVLRAASRETLGAMIYNVVMDLELGLDP